MKVIRNVATEFMKPINISLIGILGLYTTLWGMWLLSPLWDVFTRAPLYSFMSSVAPEWAWGLFAFLSGISLCWGVYRRSSRSLIVGAFIGYFHWGVNSLAYFIGDWQNTGGITSLMLAVYSLLVFLNLKKNCKWDRDCSS
jgi:hypothetical protein